MSSPIPIYWGSLYIDTSIDSWSTWEALVLPDIDRALSHAATTDLGRVVEMTVVADRQPDGTFVRYPSPSEQIADARRRMGAALRDIAGAIEVLEAGGADDYVIELLTSAQAQLRPAG